MTAKVIFFFKQICFRGWVLALPQFVGDKKYNTRKSGGAESWENCPLATSGLARFFNDFKVNVVSDWPATLRKKSNANLLWKTESVQWPYRWKREREKFLFAGANKSVKPAWSFVSPQLCCCCPCTSTGFAATIALRRESPLLSPLQEMNGCFSSQIIYNYIPSIFWPLTFDVRLFRWNPRTHKTQLIFKLRWSF